MLPRRSPAPFPSFSLSVSHTRTIFFVSNRWRFSRRCRVIQVRSGDGSALPTPICPRHRVRYLFYLGSASPSVFEEPFYALAAANINPRRNSPRSAADTPLRVPHSLPFVRVYPPLHPPPRPGLNARNLWPRYLIFRTLSSKTLDAVGS